METFDSKVILFLKALGCHRSARHRHRGMGADEGSVTPQVHPLSRDKDNIREVLGGVSDSVESISPCADARGIKSSGHKRDELHWVDKGLAFITQYSESKSRGAGVMVLNSASRRRCRASLCPNRSSNKSKITDAWSRQDTYQRRQLPAQTSRPVLLKDAMQVQAWHDMVRHSSQGATSSCRDLSWASFRSHGRQSHSVGNTMPMQFWVCSQ